MDYGSIGQIPLPHPDTGQPVNRNPETGVRYGVCSQHDLDPWILEDFESEYAYGCPECGAEFEPDADVEEIESCTACGYTPEGPCASDEWIGHEPIGWHYQADGVSASFGSPGEVWFYASPAVARGAHCSPCAPGAVYHHHPTEGTPEDGPEGYAPPAEWWREDGRS